jgi:hypothetical protein
MSRSDEEVAKFSVELALNQRGEREGRIDKTRIRRKGIHKPVSKLCRNSFFEETMEEDPSRLLRGRRASS